MATLYHVVYPSAGAAPTAAEVKAGQQSGGTPATASGNELANIVSGEQTFAALATGLTTGTSYRVAFVWSDGTANSNVAVSEPFTPTNETVSGADTDAPPLPGYFQFDEPHQAQNTLAGVGAAGPIPSSLLTGVESDVALDAIRARAFGLLVEHDAAPLPDDVGGGVFVDGVGVSISRGVASGAPATVEASTSIANALGQATAAPAGIEATAGAALARGQAGASGAPLEAAPGAAQGRGEASGTGKSSEAAPGHAAGRSQAAAASASLESAAGRAEGRAQAAAAGEDGFAGTSVPGAGRAYARGQATAVGEVIEAAAGAAIARAQASAVGATLEARAGAAAAIARAAAVGFPVEAAAGAAIGRAQATAAAAVLELAVGLAQARGQATATPADGGNVDPAPPGQTWRVSRADRTLVVSDADREWRVSRPDRTLEIDG